MAIKEIVKDMPYLYQMQKARNLKLDDYEENVDIILMNVNVNVNLNFNITYYMCHNKGHKKEYGL